MHTIVIEAIASSNLPSGKVQLVLSEDQLQELHKDLQTIAGPQLEVARSYFFDSQGYMETDSTCLAYWGKFHD